MPFHIANHFTDHLVADEESRNFTRQVFLSHFSSVKPNEFSRPSTIHFNKDLFDEIGLFKEEDVAFVFSGKKLIENTLPYSMAYAGHQFGNWAGQLGDGRAINLFEVLNEKTSEQYTMQLKGAGPTPYSRSADGYAVLRSSIREYLCAEAMHHLGVSTTRSFSLVLSGEEVLRDVMYDGNAAMEKGAIVCRVSPSFIRFGNFELFASRKEYDRLQELLQYTIINFYPSLHKTDYVGLFKEVSKLTLSTVINWQRVGFVHGVLNTDNMSIVGQTIDYGPYGWLEGFDLNWTPNTTDRQHSRYRFGAQPEIVLWNLVRLANAIYPLVKDVQPFEEVLNEYRERYQFLNLEMYRSKLGLREELGSDLVLVNDLEDVLGQTETDYTIFFRRLSTIDQKQTPSSILSYLNVSFYDTNELKGKVLENWLKWIEAYLSRLISETTTADSRKKLMDSVNPKYVLRNYMAQLAIEDAEKGDYGLFNEFYELLKRPYDEQPKFEKWFAKRPEWARIKVGCSMLSCSS